jgi:hypothetical protein
MAMAARRLNELARVLQAQPGVLQAHVSCKPRLCIDPQSKAPRWAGRHNDGLSKGEQHKGQIDRQWPHQVALRTPFVSGANFTMPAAATRRAATPLWAMGATTSSTASR